MTTPRAAMPQKLQALRSSLVERLGALEAALADPGQHGSLERLILELARIATEEADASARQAYLEALRQGEGAIAAARSEASAALEAERGITASLRQAAEQAQSALQVERAGSEAARHELTSIRQAFEQEQAARSRVRAELDAAVASLEAERGAAASLRQAAEQARTELQSERAAAATRDNELAAIKKVVEEQLKKQQGVQAGLKRELEQATAAVEQANAAVEKMRAELERTRVELESARKELGGVHKEVESARQEAGSARQELGSTRDELGSARQELDALRRDADARSKNLSQSQAEVEQSLTAARQALRDAEARAQAAIRERDGFKQQLAAMAQEAEGRSQTLTHSQKESEQALAAARQALRDAESRAEAASRERDTFKQQLETSTQGEGASKAMRKKYEDLLESSEHRIKALELAVRDAETRAEAAERDIEALRRAPAAHAAPAAGASSPPGHGPQPVAANTGASPEAESLLHPGPARAAKRVAIGELDIQVEGMPAKLVDASLTGAQILASSAMKPNRLVKLTMPHGAKTIVCKGKVMWSRVEPRGGQIWYRAGVSFTSVDPITLEAFLSAQESAR